MFIKSKLQLLLLWYCLVAMVLSCKKKEQANITASTATASNPEIQVGADLVGNPNLNIKFVTGRYGAKENNLVRIEPQYFDPEYPKNANMFMNDEAYTAFKKMADAAKKENITIFIKSAFRSFWYQKRIWEDKWNGRKKVKDEDLSEVLPKAADRASRILQYSSMPGTSRHHWGTDIDINAYNNDYFRSHPSGKKVYDWLQKHAATFGFCQPYTSEIRGNYPIGHREEKWHWSYKPISSRIMRDIRQYMTNQNIVGFDGEEVADELNILDHYINNISSACLD